MGCAGSRRHYSVPPDKHYATRGVETSYLPAARRWKRVRFSIFLCFFLRMRLRRFLINDPMACTTLLGFRTTPQNKRIIEVSLCRCFAQC